MVSLSFCCAYDTGNDIPPVLSLISHYVIFQFLQNPDLLEQLLETRGTTLAEASPNDNIWGIGLAQSDHQAGNRTTWKGENWLGIALMDAREEILNETEQKS